MLHNKCPKEIQEKFIQDIEVENTYLQEKINVLVEELTYNSTRLEEYKKELVNVYFDIDLKQAQIEELVKANAQYNEIYISNKNKIDELEKQLNNKVETIEDLFNYAIEIKNEFQLDVLQLIVNKYHLHHNRQFKENGRLYQLCKEEGVIIYLEEDRWEWDKIDGMEEDYEILQYKYITRLLVE